MNYKAADPEAYIAQLPDERKPVIEKLHQTILQHLPKIEFQVE